MVAYIVIDFLFRGEGVSYGAHGFIRDFQLLPAVGKIPVDGGRRLLQAQGKGRPIADELCRGAGHTVRKFVERVEQGGLFVPVLEDAGFIFIELIEIREDFGVAWSDLTDGVVHEPPPHRRTLLDEVQIVRAEKNGVDRVGEFSGGLFDGVHQNPLGPARREAQIHGLFPLVAVHVRQDIRAVRAEAHKLPVKAGAEALSHSEHVDRLQEIGLSLGVFTADDIGAGVKIRRLKRVIAKGAQCDAPDDHAFVTSSTVPWKST